MRPEQSQYGRTVEQVISVPEHSAAHAASQRATWRVLLPLRGAAVLLPDGHQPHGLLRRPPVGSGNQRNSSTARSGNHCRFPHAVSSGLFGGNPPPRETDLSRRTGPSHEEGRLHASAEVASVWQPGSGNWSDPRAGGVCTDPLPTLHEDRRATVERPGLPLPSGQCTRYL